VSVEPDLFACDDCVMVIANGDAPCTGDPERDRAVLEGVERLGPVALLDDEGFRWRGCDVCDSRLGGNRHGLVLLG